MRKAAIVILNKIRQEPKRSMRRSAIAEDLGRQPTDPIVTAVQDAVLAALANFAGHENWLDRVNVVTRVRALSVIRAALATALEQYSHLDPYTSKWLSSDAIHFGMRLAELRQALDGTVTNLAGPGKTTTEAWAIASQAAPRRPRLRARDFLIVVLAELFERNATISKESVLFKQHQHAFVLS
jgi:hypothetical protein